MAQHHHAAAHAFQAAVHDPAPPVSSNLLWGHVPEFWIAAGTIVLAGATIALILIGMGQISAIKRQNRRWQTLAACDRYNYDPIMDACLSKLRDAKKEGRFKDHEKDFRLEITTVLNCLEGIALGIYQGLYIEELVRDHLQGVLIDHVDEYLTDGMPGKVEFETRDFPYALALAARWTRISRPRFRETGWWPRWRRSQ
jgi:hypothetical protein